MGNPVDLGHVLDLDLEVRASELPFARLPNPASSNLPLASNRPPGSNLIGKIQYLDYESDLPICGDRKKEQMHSLLPRYTWANVYGYYSWITMCE